MNNKALVSFFSILFIISIPFYDVPRFPLEGITYSMLFGGGFVFFYSLLNFERMKSFQVPVVPIIIFTFFLGVYITSYIYNHQNLDEKGFNHIILYFVSFFFYYLCFYLALDFLGKIQVQKVIYYSLLILAFVGTVEVLMFYLYGYEVYATFLDHGENAGVYGGFFPRMRSLFNEPSHLALFVISISVFVWDISFKAKLLVAYVLFWTFSTSAAFGIVLSLFLYTLYNFYFNRSIKYKIYLLLFTIFSVSSYALLIQTPLFIKLLNFISSSNSSGNTRRDAVINSLQYLGDNPLIGLGPAFYYNYFETGLFNLYLQLYIEVGFLGLLLFISFYLYHFKAVLSKPIYFIAYFALFFQYVGMNHYYLPGMWMLLAYIHYNSKINK